MIEQLDTFVTFWFVICIVFGSAALCFFALGDQAHAFICGVCAFAIIFTLGASVLSGVTIHETITVGSYSDDSILATDGMIYLYSNEESDPFACGDTVDIATNVYPIVGKALGKDSIVTNTMPQKPCDCMRNT